MIIRKAVTSDAASICTLVNHYAEQGIMLHRSMESVYEDLRDFIVAYEDDDLLGCAAVDVYWGNQAEIRSVAVAEEGRGKGIGMKILEACIDDARKIGIKKIFAMTYVHKFFEELGFVEVDIMTLPEKVWRECLEWYAEGHRHETAMVLELK